MTRREFVLAAAVASKSPRIRALTRGPKHHFFGYYGIPPWNRSGRYLVCLETDFQDHLPRPDEAAGIGVVDAKTGEFRRLTQTRAWNFQQGAMLHWNPLKPETEFLFNERRGTEIISAAYDLETGKRRELPRAINGVSHNGRYALCLTYGRLTRLRPVVGYVGAEDPNPDTAHPENDGVFLMDLASGESKLIVSIAEVYRRLVKKHPELRERHMWFNHTVFNKDDTRFFFLARCWTPDKQLESAMFTVGVDGSSLREVVPFGLGVSHFDWRSEKEIIATFRLTGGKEKDHVLFTDGKADYRRIGAGFLTGDGHCSFAPDRQRLATDRNDGSKIEKRLLLYDLRTEQGAVLGSFPMRSKTYLSGDLRCDLHPRWSRDGSQICVDALETETWTRQLHVVAME